MKPLISFVRNVTSQAGEDGVLLELFRRIGSENRWCCEFGAWDGKHLSNTWMWIEKAKWSSVQIEGGAQKFNELKQRYDGNKRVHCVGQFVTKDNSLDSILSQTEIPKNFDFLVIDIDGNDYWIWKWLEEYRPRVVLIEFNSSMPADLHFVQKYDPEVWMGASLRALVALGKEKGYELVAALGGNAIFVCQEDYPQVGIEDNSIEALYCSPFRSMLVSDQTGKHYILKVGAYGMSRFTPDKPFQNFSIHAGAPDFTEEIFIEQSANEKHLRSIFRRGWEESNENITPIQIETFQEIRKSSTQEQNDD